MSKKNKVGAAFTDDGFAMGELLYIGVNLGPTFRFQLESQDL